MLFLQSAALTGNQCELWKNGSKWWNGHGIATSVEIMDQRHCTQLVMNSQHIYSGVEYVKLQLNFVAGEIHICYFLPNFMTITYHNWNCVMLTISCSTWKRYITVAFRMVILCFCWLWQAVMSVCARPTTFIWTSPTSCPLTDISAFWCQHIQWSSSWICLVSNRSSQGSFHV